MLANLRPIELQSCLRGPAFFICRGKKYYRMWKNPLRLQDVQNLGQGKPSLYEQWEYEKSNSSQPEIFRLLDISRLPKYLKQREARKVICSKEELMDRPLEYKRRLFALYGSSSSVDPAELFLDASSLQLEQKRESAFEPNVKNFLQEQQAKKQQKTLEIEKRMQDIQKNLEKMPQLLDKYCANQVKIHGNKEAEEAKKKAVLEEARERFGYYVDTADPKFKNLKYEMLEQEKLQKKLTKKK